MGQLLTEASPKAPVEMIPTLEKLRSHIIFQTFRLSQNLVFWVLALALGALAGLAAVGFRWMIEALQTWAYGTPDVNRLHSFAETLPWIWVVIIPTLGGLVVGVILHLMTPDGRVRSVADVIEATALHDGRVEYKAGLASAVASWITLSTGGSTGREGPMVHIGAMIASKLADMFRIHGVPARDLLGCAVAAAVSASFNAPIAGAIFALEVILRHFAIHALAPIVIASVAGTVVSQIFLGDFREFTLPTETELSFYAELPAFILLGLICGGVAVIMMKSLFFADDIGSKVMTRLGLPRFMRPAFAGFLLGGLATQFPSIIGVGYETTFAALSGTLILSQAILIAVAKTVAVSITVGGRMGGGVFSPSLMLGALTGLSFGIVATALFPEVSGGLSLYALAGMGALAAAVLGAPISTILIIFELTGNWQAALAVMVAVSISVAFASRFVDRSFFLTQLERRNIHMAAGPQTYLLSVFANKSIMVPLASPEEKHWEMVERGLYVSEKGTLEGAMPVFERTGAVFLPVVRIQGDAPAEIIGILNHLDALKAYNKALAAVSAEEHS